MGFIKKIYGIFLFKEVSELVRHARKKRIHMALFPPLSDKIEKNSESKRIYEVLQCRSVRCFFTTLASIHKKAVGLIILLLFARLMWALMCPLFLKALIEQLTKEDALIDAPTTAFIKALGLSLASFMVALCEQQFRARLGILVSIISRNLRTLLFETTLFSKHSLQKKATKGYLVNLLTEDISAVSGVFETSGHLIYAMAIIISASILLFSCLGISAMLPLLSLLFLPFLSDCIGKRFYSIESRLMRFYDNRSEIITEYVSHTRIAKILCMENAIKKRLTSIREKEITLQKKWVAGESLTMLTFLIGSTLLTSATFGLYLLLGNNLTATVVFTALVIFKILEEPCGQISWLFSSLAKSRVSMERVISFLANANLDKQKELSLKERAIGIKINDLSVSFLKESPPFLKNINLNVRTGETIAIVGETGCGKTTLLKSIMGELSILGGQVEFLNIGKNQTPRIAFLPQDPSLIAGSLKENILFGSLSSMDFDHLLHLCELTHDHIFYFGSPEYQVTSGGTNLSGGQRQRVALGRIAHQKAGLILLDTPTSALDSATAKKIAERLIFGAWIKTTCIISTNEAWLMERCDRTVFLKNGRIMAQGQFHDIMASSSPFNDFIGNIHHNIILPNESVKEKSDRLSLKPAYTPTESEIKNDISRHVPFKAYLKYVLAMIGNTSPHKILVVSGLILSSLLATTTEILQNIWITIWTDTIAAHETFKRISSLSSRLLLLIPDSSEAFLLSIIENPSHALGVYGLLGGICLLVTFSRFYIWGIRSVHAHGKIFNDLLHAVLKAPLSFFSKNRMGTIINRFTGDLKQIETIVGVEFEATIRCIVESGLAFGIVIIVFPYLSIPILLITSIVLLIERGYRNTMQDTRRFIAQSRTPLIEYYTELIDHASSIRYSENPSFFSNRFLHSLRVFQTVSVSQILVTCWFTVRIPLITSLLVGAVSLSSIFYVSQGLIHPGSCGLAILYSLEFWIYIMWLVRSFAALNASMVSVERVGLLDDIGTEDSLFKRGESLTTMENNPSHPSQLTFNKVTVRYSNNQSPALNNLSFQIKKGEHVGIRGRTGSGKSTLANAVLRLVEYNSGNIFLENQDIKMIPLWELRRKIVMVPQENHLFSGSIRSNLDPDEVFDDSTIYKILNQIGMGQVIENLSYGLDTPIHQLNHTISSGQCQLIAYARALLKNPDILILDEATAQISPSATTRISIMITSLRKKTTLIIIAHHFETLMRCDKVITLQDGKIINTTYKSEYHNHENCI